MKWLLWPGEKVCDLLGLKNPDDRQALRLFANVIFWNAVVVAIAILVA